ncbi:hypothetical protein Vi05172_g9528 [Venturia inaequalis]|nr:hypothetical protein Vi05172_g9528 [Venturia inaequalis]
MIFKISHLLALTIFFTAASATPPYTGCNDQKSECKARCVGVCTKKISTGQFCCRPIGV